MAGNGEVTLVGHSMGGLSVTAATEVIPDKIACVVYLTAYVPVLRKAVFDYLGLPENAAAQGGQVLPGDAVKTGAVRLNPHSADASYLEMARQAFYNDLPMAEAFRFIASLVPDVPLSVALEDARGTPARWGTVPRTYIRCTLDNALPIALQDLMIKEADTTFLGNAFDVKTLVSSHSPFASVPDKLAALLHELR
jgi:pimeloyl-ACP methyl ester carboxylesterase